MKRTRIDKQILKEAREKQNTVIAAVKSYLSEKLGVIKVRYWKQKDIWYVLVRKGDKLSLTAFDEWEYIGFTRDVLEEMKNAK